MNDRKDDKGRESIINPKIKDTEINIATINVRGINKAGSREEIEQWMKEKNVKIAALQETKTTHNTRECRKNYTFYFSGQKQEEK